MNIKVARTDAEIESCFEVVKALRPHIEKEVFVRQIREMMQETYQMIYICEEDKPVAFAGFRDMQMLYCGKIIYIDDLSTLPECRGKGYAGKLLDHIHQLAKETGKAAVHLDSGHHRHDAHRLYLTKRYRMIGHHFERPIL